MRARNMQALTDAIKRRHPGVIIYGIGDDAHALRVSDHNEDDTPGVLAAQQDADSNPEHRAIDVMLGAAFTKSQAYQLIDDLLADPTARARLRYIIFDGWIWSRSNGWTRHEFEGDPHRDHPHISGWAADDENAAAWPAVDGDDMALSDADAKALINRVNTIIDMADVNPYGDSLKPEPNKLGAAIKALATVLGEVAADVEELKAKPPVQSAPVDEAALKAVLMDPEVIEAYAARAAQLVHDDLAD